jgi:hypothetical protein
LEGAELGEPEPGGADQPGSGSLRQATTRAKPSATARAGVSMTERSVRIAAQLRVPFLNGDGHLSSDPDSSAGGVRVTF